MKPILRVVGCAGQRRNGKDTISDYLAPRLVRRVPVPVHGGVRYEEAPWGRTSFAAEVKRIYCETFDKDLAFVEEWKVRAEIPPGMTMNVRDGLTFIGDGFRRIQPNIWIDLAFRTQNDPHYRVFSDLRYVNEARRIRSEGGINILLYRDGFVNWDPDGSERAILPFLLWCAWTGREGEIARWPEFRDRTLFPGEDREAERSDLVRALPPEYGNFFEDLSQFDLFVRAPTGVENLHAKAEEIVLPYIRENYVTWA